MIEVIGKARAPRQHAAVVIIDEDLLQALYDLGAQLTLVDKEALDLPRLFWRRLFEFLRSVNAALAKQSTALEVKETREIEVILNKGEETQ